MARSYRFFARHLLEESFPTSKFAVFHLTETLEPEIFQQLTRVLRVKSGDGIIFIPARRDAPFPEYHY
ncbi:MAG TPA: hypothetical protein VI588_02245, partial [Candidatus Gracilibacteria bacterium]|nr:hypothetical protein [Candidatus Gracilibacteria bacterium]